MELLITICYIELLTNLISHINQAILDIQKLKATRGIVFINTPDNGIFATIMIIKMSESMEVIVEILGEISKP
jgi:hypothetical protein